MNVVTKAALAAVIAVAASVGPALATGPSGSDEPRECNPTCTQTNEVRCLDSSPDAIGGNVIDQGAGLYAGGSGTSSRYVEACSDAQARCPLIAGQSVCPPQEVREAAPQGRLIVSASGMGSVATTSATVAADGDADNPGPASGYVHAGVSGGGATVRCDEAGDQDSTTAAADTANNSVDGDCAE